MRKIILLWNDVQALHQEVEASAPPSGEVEPGQMRDWQVGETE